MEHTDNITDPLLRDVNRLENHLIYKLYNPEELAALSDEEFISLQSKLRYYTSSKCSIRAYFNDFFEGEEDKTIAGNEVDYAIFKRKSIIGELPRYFCFYRYERLFTLIHALEINNIYDIGCGDDLQALMLVYDQDMHYTGIDSRIFDYPFDNFVSDPQYVNKIIEKFTGSDRIKFINATYPCDLEVSDNNIALVLNVLGLVEGNNPILTALYENFERIIVNIPDKTINPLAKQMSAKEFACSNFEGFINPFDEQYEFYKQLMPEYVFYKIGRNTIFGTKIAADIEKLENNYFIAGDTVTIGVLDTHWIHKVF